MLHQAFFSKRKIFNPKDKTDVMLHSYLTITAVVERLYIGLTEGIAATVVTNTLFSRVTHFSLTGSDVHQASAISGLDVSRCK